MLKRDLDERAGAGRARDQGDNHQGPHQTCRSQGQRVPPRGGLARTEQGLGFPLHCLMAFHNRRHTDLRAFEKKVSDSPRRKLFSSAHTLLRGHGRGRAAVCLNASSAQHSEEAHLAVGSCEMRRPAPRGALDALQFVQWKRTYMEFSDADAVENL